MRIVPYPHPALRHVSRPVKRVDAELRQIVAQMFDLMYEAHGVGLAANQVDLPLRVFVCNLEGERAARESEMVFINPVLSGHKGTAEQDEGCLSLPELFLPVKRPERVQVSAYNLSGEKIEGELDGLFARVVQHETDHLDGILFTDRVGAAFEKEARQALEQFETDFLEARRRNEYPDDTTLADRRGELEARYC